jgi:16S rRNA (cytosine1402-N4)-methyltransferase
MKKFHEPVLLKEIIEYLNVQPGRRYVDATVGGGGHAAAICQGGGRVLGIDVDPEAIRAAREYLSSACPNASWRLAQGNFSTLTKTVKKHDFNQADGVVFDLGVSSHQLEKESRGFSFQVDAALDMRMDPGLKVTAADLVNGLSKKELAELFFKFGDERCSRQIAAAVVRARQQEPIKTGNQLAQIILKARPRRGRFDRTHPATKCFQALRIAVNDELDNLKKALPQALALLASQGKLAVVSFHSGEDRIVKQFFKDNAEAGKLQILTKKPIRSSPEEVGKNPRSRSSRLRVAEKK